MKEVLLVFPRLKYPSPDPPLGVAYLAACLREAGHGVSVFDATFTPQPLESLAEVLRGGRFGLVAISALTSMIRDTAQVARVVREVSPQSVVVLGGPHATVDPAGAAAVEGVDAVYVGEGELGLPALADAGSDFRALPGFRWLEDGTLQDNGPAPVVEDLDRIPYPAWDLLPVEQYLDLWYQLDAVRYGLRGTSIIASRGCPFDCAYCQPTLRTIFGRRIRRRSPGNIIGELAELKSRYAIDGVMWLDDTFLLDRKWMRDLCEGLIQADLNLLWGCNVRADVVDRETLELMKAAGLRVVHVGIESATQRILDEVYCKGITVEQAREAVTLARSVGLSVRGYFMLGAPTETQQEAWDTVKLACSLPLDDATFSITTPLPHTHLWEKTRALVSREAHDFDYYKVPVYEGSQVVPAARLVFIKRVAYLWFYLGPRRFVRTVRSLFSRRGVDKMLLKVRRF